MKISPDDIALTLAAITASVIIIGSFIRFISVELAYRKYEKGKRA